MTDLLPQQKNWNQTQMIAQGAEGRVYVVHVSEMESHGQFLNAEKLIYKHRLSKAYRHPELDKSILSARLSAESRNILRALQSGVDAPYVWRVETDGLWLEYIHGVALRVLFDDLENRSLHLELCKEIGRQIARLHSNDLIHGDLTTSNIMIRYKKSDNNTVDEPQIQTIQSEQLDWTTPTFIDFGLSYVSTQLEDKAVDLYVLERAILSTHTQASDLFKAILEGYAESESGPNVLKTFEKVRLRGRKREMIG